MKKALSLLFAIIFLNKIYSQATNKIDTTGNIGIGITVPGSPLHVKQSSQTSSSGVRLDNSSNDASLRTYNDGANWIFSPSYSTGGALHPILFTNSVGGDNTLKLETNGYVGVGTTSAGARFHVKQSAQTASDGFRLDNSTNDASLRTYHDGTNWVISPAYSSGGALHPILFTNAIGGSNTLYLSTSGKVGIGTTSPAEKLSVDGNIRTRKVIVTQSNWADYVFAPEYRLAPLDEVSAFIKKHKHLPGIPSAKEVEENGVDVGDNQVLLLKKIEELTLYIIALNKMNEKLMKDVEILKSKK